MDIHKTQRLESQISQLQQEQQPSKNGTTFIRTCFNGINALSGVGILSIPYALSEGGWLSLMILIIVASLCYYTGLLLKRCMDSDPLIKTYPDIGNHAFGKKGRLVISTFVYVILYLLAVEFLILEGDNLHKLFPNVFFHLGGGGHKVGGKQVFVLLAALVILPTTWLRSFGLLAYVSVGGILASIILLGCVLWVGVADDYDVGFHQKGSLWNWKGLPTTISLFTFCYSGHAVLPTLCNSMKDRGQFHKVWLVCFVLTTATYGSIAIMGYLMFGGNLTSQITLNLPTKKLGSKIAIYTTLINPVTKYAITVAPIMTAIEDKTPFQGRRLLGLLIRTVLVISTLVVALTIPFFGYIMAFIGSFLSMSVSVLFPCLCYLKIYKAYKIFSMQLAMIIVIVLSGVFVSVLGTYVSVRNIIIHVGK